ncbi:MAG TPA: enoyl-CoA hydratase-related protein, partial [Hyphomicrobiaceae bacterium]|nr:enoyl-CoA hydratase-related protein [Hyphomicrobiaceae bacterium]
GGADLDELGGLCADSARLYITRLHKACRAIRDCPVPVIARVNGFCLGAGLEVAASADMRVASRNAVFGMPEVHMGLPSVIEAALLPGLIGWGRTREILLTGETFGADAALSMGLVQKVVPPSELDMAVSHWIELIARATPAAVRSQKALMNRWERVSVEEGVMAGIDALSDAYKTGEPQAAIGAFFAAKAKRKS